MLSWCFDFHKKSKRNMEYDDDYLRDIENHLILQDWSNTRKTAPTTIESLKVAAVQDETDPYVFPQIIKFKCAGFKEIFTLAYQKCLYGPLTTIPRPLQYLVYILLSSLMSKSIVLYFY